MYHFMGYNKDKDQYTEIKAFFSVEFSRRYVEKYRMMLREDLLRDKGGEPYDWIEVWDDKDDNGYNDYIISR